MKYLALALCFMVMGCAAKPPKTHTAAPALTSAKKSVTDAKDFISRAQLSNRDINALIKELEGLKK